MIDDTNSEYTKYKVKEIPELVKPTNKSIKNRQRQRKNINPLSKAKSLYLMARCNRNMTEFERKQILFHELEAFDDEVRSKNVHTQCKANIFRFANVISSFIVIVAGAVIVGLQATSSCISIPSLILAGLLTVTQALYEVFRWGPQGVFFKQSTIRLKRVRRQINDIKLMIHQYTIDQLMNEIRYMRNEYDDIDFSTYKMSTGGDAKLKTNIIEVVNDVDQIQMEPMSDHGTPASNRTTPTYHASSPSLRHENNVLHQQLSPYYNNQQINRSPRPPRSPYYNSQDQQDKDQYHQIHSISSLSSESNNNIPDTKHFISPELHINNDDIK